MWRCIRRSAVVLAVGQLDAARRKFMSFLHDVAMDFDPTRTRRITVSATTGRSRRR